MKEQKVNCSNCAYSKRKMSGIVCNNSQSEFFNQVMGYSETCSFGTGREDDGFVTVIRGKNE